MFKLFIPPQTDGPSFRFREANVHTFCISLTLSQNSLRDKQTNCRTQSTHRKARLEPAIKDAQKRCAERFSALKCQIRSDP